MLSRLKSQASIFTLLAVLMIFIGGTVVLMRHLFPKYDAWSPDGEWLSFSCGNVNESNIFIMRPDGDHLQQLTHSADASLPSWSPDGQWIVFVKNSSLYRIRPNGRDIEQILDNSSESGFDFWDTSPSWSPDGQWIAFTSNRSRVNERDIYLVSLERNDIERVTEGMSVYSTLMWSPDGEKIVFSSDSLQQQGLYIIEIDGMEQKEISELNLMASEPAFSPDGETIVFSMEYKDSIDLFAISTGGGEVQHLTGTSNVDSYPKWSPNGNSIVFSSSGDNGFSQIYTMTSDGSKVEVITSLECHAISPAWYSFDSDN